MAIWYKPGKGKGIMDISMHEGEDYNEEQKHEIINDAISAMYEQLQGNATNICTYNSDLWADNLLSDTLERFLKRHIDAKWSVFMEGKLERYITSGMSIALHSKTSPFYSKYRKPNSKFRELITGGAEYDYSDNIIGPGATVERKQLWEDIHGYIDKLNFYDKFLVTEYFMKEIKIKEIARKTNINASSVSRDIKKALVKLKEMLKHRFND